MENFKIVFIIILLSIGFSSCDSMFDIQERYIQKGGIIYSTRPYMPIVKAGDNRAVVKMLFVSGANLQKNIIEWNDGRDSVVTDLKLNAPLDSLEIEIKDIKEGSYIFNVYNLDKDNNRSIKIQAIGNVYGDKYKATLLNRALNSITKNDTAMVINWAQPKEGDNGVELVYKDANGNQNNYRVAADELVTYIKSWESKGTLNYTTFYLPEEDAIDEFPCPTESVVMVK